MDTAVSRRRMLAAVIGAALCCGCNPVARTAADAAPDPLEVLRRVYTLPDPYFDAFIDPAVRPSFYVQRIVDATAATERCFKKTFGMDHLDFDYIVPGQDYDIRDFSMDMISSTDTHARVAVRFQNFPDTAPMELLYDLERVGDRWLIAETTYDGRTLSESLSGDC